MLLSFINIPSILVQKLKKLYHKHKTNQLQSWSASSEIYWNIGSLILNHCHQNPTSIEFKGPYHECLNHLMEIFCLRMPREQTLNSSSWC